MSGASFDGPITGHNVLAGVNVSGTATLNAYFNRDELSPSPSLPPSVYRSIPYPRNEDIIHRSDPFTKLDSLLPRTTEYRTAALWGLGGSGKTQIALDYAYRRCEDPAYSVLWVHADTLTTFTQDYKTIAKKIGVDGASDDKTLLAAVRAHLETLPNWLLVIDNADDLSLFGVGSTAGQSVNLLDYIPRGATGTVLWTSRDERIAGTLVGARRGIKIANMTAEEAIILLETARNETIEDYEREDSRLLLEELQYLPLVITQAGSYMRRTLTTIKEYLVLLADSKERWQVLGETEMDRHRRPDVPNSILETWRISIERIRQESEAAYKVLHILAYLDNQDIPFEIIVEASSNNPAEQSKEALIVATRLKEFSFISVRRTEQGRSYEMHKLVQEAIRYSLRNGREDDRTFFSKIALQVIIGLFPKPVYKTWATCEKYLRHAIRVGEWASGEEAERQVCRLLRRVSSYLYSRGRWKERETTILRLLDLQYELFGEKNPDTITSMESLGVTYDRQGRYTEEKQITLKVLELRREVLGERHPDTINTMSGLAVVYRHQGQYKEAEQLQARAFELQQELLGIDHPDTMHTMTNLARIYHRQGRYSKAEEILAKALKLQLEILGDKHLDTIRTMMDLAGTYRRQAYYKKAEKLQAKALKLQQDLLGEKHPDTIQTLADLSTTYYYQGRYDESEQISIRALELQTEVLGEKHPDTAITIADLATTHRRQGRYDKAEQFQTKALELQQELLGPTHPDTVGTMASLAGIFYSQHKYSDAERIGTKALELHRRVLGEKNHETLQTMINLAAAFYSQHKYSEAEQVGAKALELYREVLGENHPDTLSAMHNLAMTWWGLGQIEEATNLMLQCWQARCTVLGSQDPITERSGRELKQLQSKGK